MLHFSRLESATARNFADGETTAGCAVAFSTSTGNSRGRLTAVARQSILANTAIPAVVFFHYAATGGTSNCQGRVVAWNRVAVKFFRLFDDVLGHLGYLAHKRFAAQFPVLHQRKFVLPATGEFGLGKFFYPQTAQQSK